jgi:hypothetical protein
VPTNGQFLFAENLAIEAGGSLEIIIDEGNVVPILVEGTFQMGGTLIIRTSSATDAPGQRFVPSSMIVAQGTELKGLFDAIDVKSVDHCTAVTAQPVYQSSTQMSVNLSTESVCIPLTQGAWIAIGVGSFVGLVLIIVLIVIIYKCLRKRYQNRHTRV